MDFAKMSRRQQDAARTLARRDLADVPEASVSQVAKHFDDVMAWREGGISLQTLCQRTGWTAPGPAEEPAPDYDALHAERDRLLARLEEIEATLPEPPKTSRSTREVAAALGVSIRTVQRWAAQGRVEAHKAGTRWVIVISL